MDLGKSIKALWTAGILIIIGLLLFPGIHLFNDSVDVTGWLPLNAAGMAFLPYAALGVVFILVLWTLSSWKSG